MIYFGKRRTENSVATVPLPIDYGVWERSNQMPLDCLALVTYTNGQQITHFAAGVWKAELQENGIYKVIMNNIQFTFHHKMFLGFELP